jgi:paraquat-inducible protein B
MSKRNAYRGLVLAAALTISACAKPPQAEMQAAQAAMEEAKTAGGESYAPESWSKAQESMSQAKAEMEAQANKFALMRSYTKSKLLIAQARADAYKAKEDVAAGRVQAQADAQKALDQSRADLDAAVAAVASAPAGKDSRADIEAMKGDLTALRRTLDEAQAATAAGDFATAKQKAKQVRQQAAAISADVAHAVHRTKRA